jgi:hypothetical protein
LELEILAKGKIEVKNWEEKGRDRNLQNEDWVLLWFSYAPKLLLN